jgi:type I restriction enzyme, S subunit
VDLNADHISGAPTPSLLDWEFRPVGSVGTVIRGASPRPQGDPRFYGGNVPRLMVGDVTRDGKFVTPVVDSLTEAGAKLSRPCKAGTLTIVCSGTVGIPSFLKVDACIHDGFLALIGIKEGYNDDYLYHQFCRLRQSFESSATHGGVFTNLTTTGVRDFVVQFPPTIAEQEAIANALSDADALIESLEQLLTKKRQIKQGAMQELLTGKRRLPGFNRPWVEKLFAELFDFSGGLSASRGQLGSNGYCYLHYGDIHTSSKSFVDVAAEYQKIPKLKISLNKVGLGCLLNDGDVVFVDASEDDAGTSKYQVVLNPEGIPFIAGLHTIVAKRKDNELAPIYLRHCFQQLAVKEQFRFFAVGTKVAGVSKSNIRKITLAVPNVDEQIAIGHFLSDIEAEITELEFKLTKARQIKQGMMQELLTGRIRLV